MALLLDCAPVRRLQLFTALALTALGGVGAANAAPFVYVTNIDSGDVSQYDAAGGTLEPLEPATVSTEGHPYGVAVSPDGKNVYVTVLAATLDEPGALLHFSVGADGGLILESPVALPSGASVGGLLAVSPDGQSVYVIGSAGPAAGLLQYSVEADGSLTPKSPPTVPATGVGSGALTVSPDSRSVYVLNSVTGLSTVSQYTAATDGTLTPKSPALVPIGLTPFAEPDDIAVSPDGKSVYVADFEGLITVDGALFQYTVGADGTLSPKSPPSVSVNGDPTYLAISPDGGTVYVTRDLYHVDTVLQVESAVLQYVVAADGVLTPTQHVSPTGDIPSDIAISSDGQSVYVTNAGADAISQYSVGADGVLTPRDPAIVTAGKSPIKIAVTAAPGLPASKDDCKRNGWRNFPQFKNQGDCVSFVNTGK